MEIKQAYQIYESLEGFDQKQIRKIICNNLKKYRLELYNRYKERYNGAEGNSNPYSTINRASYLGISQVHYKRLENENDKSKYIGIDNLIKLSIVFNKKLDDFLK